MEMQELACGCEVLQCSCGDRYHKDFGARCDEAARIHADLTTLNRLRGAEWDAAWDALVQHYGDNW